MLHGRQPRRNPWAALLAVVLGMFAGAGSVLGVSANSASGTSVSEQTTDARSASRTVSVRFDVYDPSIGFGGEDDAPYALRNDEGALSRLVHLQPNAPRAFGLTVSLARVRNGLTRAPPLA